MQSIKYLHYISTLSPTISQKDAKHQISPLYLHYIFYYISKRCKASNISTISLLYHPPYLKKMQSIKYLHYISTISSTISQKDAKHQISPHYHPLYLPLNLFNRNSTLHFHLISNLLIITMSLQYN